MLIPDAAKPYLIIGVGVLWSASLIGMGYWQNDAGHTAERVLWQDKENLELREANETILRLQTEARETERAHAERMATVSTNYQKELQDEKNKRDRDVAAARAGTLKLRFNTVSLEASTGSTGTTPAASSGCDGQAGSELRGSAEGDLRVALPEEITAKLFDLAYDADEVVKQLHACQAVILSDRKGGDPMIGGGSSN